MVRFEIPKHVRRASVVMVSLSVLVAVVFASCENPIAQMVEEDIVVERAGGRPEIASIFPALGATNIATNAQISVTFDESLLPTSVTSEVVSVSGSDGAAVAGTLTYSDASQSHCRSSRNALGEPPISS